MFRYTPNTHNPLLYSSVYGSGNICYTERPPTAGFPHFSPPFFHDRIRYQHRMISDRFDMIFAATSGLFME